MEFVEATLFTRLVYKYLSDDEYVGLQRFLALYPEAGTAVPGSGGVRKIRWAVSGRGKSSGVRVIYYYKRRADRIWLLTIYSKSETENIAPHILRKIAQEVEDD